MARPFDIITHSLTHSIVQNIERACMRKRARGDNSTVHPYMNLGVIEPTACADEVRPQFLIQCCEDINGDVTKCCDAINDLICIDT